MSKTYCISPSNPIKLCHVSLFHRSYNAERRVYKWKWQSLSISIRRSYNKEHIQIIRYHFDSEMSFRYAFPRFSRMMGSYGQGFGWRRRGAGSFCRLYYGDKYWPAWRMRSPYCRRADWIESQYRDPENAPSGLRDWFNWKPWWFRENYSVNKVQDKDIAVCVKFSIFRLLNIFQIHKLPCI